MTKEKLCKIAGILCSAISIVILYIANRKMIFQMDDDWYITNLVTGQPVEGFADIFESQVWHFFHWGGRSVAHAILQLVLWAGPMVADCLNVLVTLLLVVLVCKLAGAKGNVFGLMTLSFLVILNINWAQTLLWQSGVANYLYMTTIILIFLLLYFRTLENVEARKLPGILFFIAPLGLMAGWSNENMGPAVWVGTAGIILFLWIKEKRFYPWMVVGNLFCLAGCGLLLLAPGNFVRKVEAVEEVAEKGLLWRLFLRCFSLTNGLFYYLLNIVVLLAVFLWIYCAVLGKKLRRTDFACLIMGVLSWGAMILSPHYPDRAAFGTMVLLLIPLMHMIAKIWESQKKSEIPGYLATGFIWLCGMFPLCTYICQMLGWIK